MTVGAVRTIPGKFRGMSLCLLVVGVGLKAGWGTDWIGMELATTMSGGVVRHGVFRSDRCLCWHKKYSRS